MTEEWAFDGEGRLVDLSGQGIVANPPPRRATWLPVLEVGDPLGLPCAVSRPVDVAYGFRVTRRPYPHLGGVWVNVCPERWWWRWVETADRPPGVPRSRAVRAVQVWVPSFALPLDTWALDG